MPPEIPILAQSDSKAKFLDRLGLSANKDESKRIYAMMKEEAVAGRARMSATTDSLLPNLVNDPNVRPPYSNTQISEAAMHEQTLYIYYHARPETLRYYKLGHYQEGDVEENWIIKWLLWHVFRYRDSRNRGKGAVAGASRISETPEAVLAAQSAFPTSDRAQSGIEHGVSSFPLMPLSRTSSLSPYPLADPSPIDVDATNRGSANQTESHVPSRSPSQGYWDPVRETHRSSR